MAGTPASEVRLPTSPLLTLSRGAVAMAVVRRARGEVLCGRRRKEVTCRFHSQSDQ